MNQPRAVLMGTGIEVPPIVVDNTMLSRVVDTSDEWIRERSGIVTRHFVEPGVGSSQLGAAAVFKLMLRNPVIVTIALIEFCTGFLRQAIMQWFRTYAKQTDGVLGLKTTESLSGFVFDNWGVLLCCAGILGGVFADEDPVAALAKWPIVKSANAPFPLANSDPNTRARSHSP